MKPYKATVYISTSCIVAIWLHVVLTFVMSDGDVLFFGRSLIVAPPSKIVDIDIREIESSDIGLVQPSSCN